MRGSLEIISSVVMFWIVVTYISVMYVSSAVAAPTTSRPRSASVAVRRSERDREARRGELIKAARAFPYQDICKLIRVGESVYRVDSSSGAPHSSDNFPPSSRRDSILPTPVFSDVKTTTSCAFFSIQFRHGLPRLATTMTSHNFTNACRCVFYINLFFTVY